MIGVTHTLGPNINALHFGNTVALGVDWSGGKKAHRKIWAAQLSCRGDHAVVECLERPFLKRLQRPFGPSTIQRIAADFAPWLDEKDFEVAGLDFCFGLAAEQMKQLRLPLGGPSAVGSALASFSSADAFRSGAAPERSRETDRQRH
jgi:hypothetical protein